MSHFRPLSGQSLVMMPPLGEGVKLSDGTLGSWQMPLTLALDFCRGHSDLESICEADRGRGGC